MKLELIQKAYAKLNLHLEVLNKRPDGYHNILSLMAQVAYADLLKLEEFEIIHENSSENIVVEIKSDTGLFCDELKKVPVESNLIYKAVQAFCRFHSINGSFTFQIEKNIPFGAGLGGGSANAAATLLLLNELYGNLSLDRLAEIGSTIGADVPFCVYGKYALCQGIGEIVEVLKSGLKYNVIIVNNGIHSDTAKAYSFLNRSKVAVLDKKEEVVNIKKHFISEDKSMFLDNCINDFEEPVFMAHPELQGIKDYFRESGADFSQMTGSGSSVFGLYRSKEKAEKALIELKKRYKFVVLTEFAY